MIIDRDALGRIVVWDGPYTAHRLAKLAGHAARAKHAGMTDNPHFDTLSVVTSPRDLNHLDLESLRGR